MKNSPNSLASKAPLRFVFFGTPQLSVTVLNELEKAGYLPACIVTRMDAPVGRGKVLTPPPVKIWADARSIKTIQPKRITDEVVAEIAQADWDLFIVAAYGRLLPQTVLDIPKKGTLNVHPSLLPRLRGPSPIRAAILQDEKETGVSIMVLDADMDHGPIVAQEKTPLPEWPPRAHELETILAQQGGRMLATVLPRWITGEVAAIPQDHEKATFCKMIKKEDGLIDLTKSTDYENLLKIRGLEGWPNAYTFFERNEQRIRVQILTAHLDGEKLVVDTVKPEGKNAMNFNDFLRSGAKPLKNT